MKGIVSFKSNAFKRGKVVHGWRVHVSLVVVADIGPALICKGHIVYMVSISI